MRSQQEAASVDAVASILEEMKQVTSFEEFVESIWPQDLFHHCGEDESLYSYVQRALQCTREDERFHRDIAQDGAFSAGLVVPRQFYKALTHMSLRRGVHSETLLLALASNITWLEHHWTRLGADPPPEGYNMVEHYVDATVYATGPASRQLRQPGPFVMPTEDQHTLTGARGAKRARKTARRVLDSHAQSKSTLSALPVCPQGLGECVRKTLVGTHAAQYKLSDLKRINCSTLTVPFAMCGW